MRYKIAKVHSISLLVLLLCVITFMQIIYSYIRETNYVHSVYISIYMWAG